ncbi:hypothetical protein [Paenibacillus sp. FSL W8-0194]|uniref:hypothetical protein n=1 Tax=Paenibacillus sp. FSL W8-0194 TaxID=2921711 RepID=UPI0030DC923F
MLDVVPRTRSHALEGNTIDLLSVISRIETAASNHHMKELERLIHSLDISDQLGLHGELSLKTLKVIKDHKDQVNINKAVKEHMIWYYFSQQEWSDSILAEVIKIYEQEGFIALESIVISALKENKVLDHQIETIRKAFKTKESIKQIGKWVERNGKVIQEG